MSIADRVRELNGGTYTKKSYSVEEVQSILGITRQTVYKPVSYTHLDVYKRQE